MWWGQISYDTPLSIACMPNLQFGCIRFLQDLYTFAEALTQSTTRVGLRSRWTGPFPLRTWHRSSGTLPIIRRDAQFCRKAEDMTYNIEYISNTSCLKILRSYKYYSYFIQSNLRLLNMFRHQTLVPRSLFDAIHYILTLQCSTSFVVSKHNLLTGKAWIPLHIGHMLGRCT